MGVPTHLVESVHAYTRADSPWLLDADPRPTAHGRLLHFLSGGGMRSCGRTVADEELSRRQTRFLVRFALVSAVWLGLWIFA